MRISKQTYNKNPLLLGSGFFYAEKVIQCF